jgi:phosphatidylinositol alpha-1,6-mannosyltransferase
MTALLVTNDFPPMAGGEATCYARMCATVPPRQVLVLAPRLPGDQAFDREQPYRVIRKSVPTSSHPLARLAQILVFFGHTLSITRREQIEVVHFGHLYLGLIGLTLNRLIGTPYVIYLHGGEMASFMRLRAVRAIARAIIRRASVVVVNSEFTRHLYASMDIDLARAETLMMSAGTERFRPDLDPRPIRARYGLDEHKVILTVGRLVERKGHDIVIRALPAVERAVGPIRYLIAGQGPEELKLRQLARDLECEDRVRFIGHASTDELPSLYAACDVFVMPSRPLAQRDGVEGFGIVFLEAGACSKPVVGGRSGGIPEAVLDGVTGVLVNPTDVDELARVLVRLLRNREEAVRLGMEGRRRAEAIESAWGATLKRIWGPGAAAR